jgi:hypothetical protein
VACNQSEHKSCQAFLAGQLLLASYQLGNFPTRAQASDIFVSVATFYLQLGGVNLKSYVEDSPSRQRHDRCNRGGKMLKELASVYADLPSVVLDSHCVHMKEQWKKGNPDPEFS